MAYDYTISNGIKVTDSINVELNGEQYRIIELRESKTSLLENNKEILMTPRYELIHNHHTVNRSTENPNNFTDPMTGEIYSISYDDN